MLIDGVHDHSTNGDLIGGTANAHERIVEQGGTESATLSIGRDGQPGENRYWDGEVTGQALSCLSCSLVVIELTSNQRVIAIDGLIAGNRDKRPCRVASLILPGIPNEPAVEEFVAATEA